METFVEKVGMPMDEYIRQYEEQPFELINGERIEKMPNVYEHGEIIEFLYLAIRAIISASQMGKIAREMPFVLSYTPKWVTGSRVPDLMYFTAERINAYKEATPNFRKMPFVIVPDIVIEVVSPTDNLHELDKKVNQYLIDGVKVVWVFDPQPQTASIHTLTALQPFTKQQVILKAEETLTGGDLIPGFEIKVATVFA